MSNNNADTMADQRGRKPALVPTLRFPEFRNAGDWEKKKMGEVIKLEYGSALSEDKRKGGAVPVVGSNGIVGYHDEYLVAGPAIVIGRKGSVGQVNWIDLDCYPIDTSYYVDNKDPQNYSLSFLGKLLEHSNLARLKDPSAVPGLSRDTVHSLISCFPKFKEQQKIADCFLTLDELISEEVQKLSALKIYKNGLMQQLFPHEGEAVPKLRLSKYLKADDWKKRKVSDLLTRSTKPVDVEVEAAYREIGIRSHGKGIFHKGAVRGKSLGDKRVFWVEPSALVVNIVFAWEQAIAVTSKAEKGMIASHRFPMYKEKVGKCDVNFIKYFFLTKKGKELLGVASPGGAGRNKTLGQKSFESLEFFTPDCVEEQAEIARCLLSVDETIAIQTERIDALRSQRKGLMQHLFPVLKEAQE
ncbi:restriction endonuclease subunit S [Achromobacter insuavis]|uniref:restriction endonuclease subunit S n=1 Tax=Achromobacter insuavis TaxID=1287735 RepID=UPI003B9A08BD